MQGLMQELMQQRMQLKKFELTKLQPNFEVMDIKDLKPDLSELSDAKDFLDNSDILKDISKKLILII